MFCVLAAIPCSTAQAQSYTVLHTFSGPDSGNPFAGLTGQSPDGNSPSGDLTFDRQGNIYGTTEDGGQYSYGTVYELVHLNGGWTESVLYSFNPQPEMVTDGAYPAGGVVFDNAGDLLGTTGAGALFEIPGLYPSGYGVVFKLTPVNNGWTETVLYTFQDDGDGALPFAGLTPAVVGGQQTFYGTTAAGGTGSCSIAMIWLRHGVSSPGQHGLQLPCLSERWRLWRAGSAGNR